VQVEVTARAASALSILLRGGHRIEVSRGFAGTLRELITVVEQG
jgi:hypothetical protein